MVLCTGENQELLDLQETGEGEYGIFKDSPSVRTNEETLTVCCHFTSLVENDGGFQDLDNDVDFQEVSSNQLESGRSYQRWQGKFDDI